MDIVGDIPLHMLPQKKQRIFDSPEDFSAIDYRIISSTAPFVMRLYVLLNKGFSFIKWRTDGEAFVICSPTELMKHLLKKQYMSSDRFTSLVRQLNIYGFSRIPNDNLKELIYRHECFHRDKPEVLPSIVRRVCGMVVPLVKPPMPSAVVVQPSPTALATLTEQVAKLTKRVSELEASLERCCKKTRKEAFLDFMVYNDGASVHSDADDFLLQS